MKWFRSKEKTVNSTLDDTLLPCFTGEDVIKIGAAAVVQEIRQLISVPLDIYQSMYAQLLSNVAECFQSMPLHENQSAYSLLNSQFKLCITVLKQRQGLILPTDAIAEESARQEPLWTFALFSASLLFQLYRLQHDRTVIFYDAEGKEDGTWTLFSGTLFRPACYFKVRWGKNVLFPDATIMALWIKQTMPREAMEWLFQEPILYQQWWFALTDSAQPSVITGLLRKAAVDSQYDIVLSPTTSSQTPSVDKNNAPPSTAVPPVVNAGPPAKDQLLHWLEQKAVEVADEPALFKLKEGLFVSDRMLKEFIDLQDHWDSPLELIEEMQADLWKENDSHEVSVRPQQYEDRRIFKGILIKQEALSAHFKAQLEQTQFQLAM